MSYSNNGGQVTFGGVPKNIDTEPVRNGGNVTTNGQPLHPYNPWHR